MFLPGFLHFVKIGMCVNYVGLITEVMNAYCSIEAV